MLRSDNRHRDSYLRPTERYQCRPARRLSLVCLNWLALSLSETYALKYWWCSPPRTGIASVRPTVWTNAASVVGTSRDSQTNNRRSALLRAGLFGDLRLSTLICWRRTKICASLRALDREQSNERTTKQSEQS